MNLSIHLLNIPHFDYLRFLKIFFIVNFFTGKFCKLRTLYDRILVFHRRFKEKYIFNKMIIQYKYF